MINNINNSSFTSDFILRTRKEVVEEIEMQCLKAKY